MLNKNKVPFLTLFIVFLITLMSCNNNSIKVLHKNFGPFLNSSGNIELEFNENLAPENIADDWDTTSYFTLTPKVEGKFRWASKRKLIFSPSEKLPANTKYTMTFTDKLNTLSAKKRKLEVKSFDFKTYAMNLEKVSAQWSDKNTDKKGNLLLNLKFNYEVKPSEISRYINVIIDNESKSFEISSTTSNTEVLINIFDVKKENKATKGTVLFTKNFIDGQWVEIKDKSDEIKVDFDITNPNELEIVETSTLHDGEIGKIIVYSSLELKSTDLNSFITITPKVDFVAKWENDALVIESKDFETNSSYNLTIKSGIRSVSGSTLNETFEKEISFGSLEPTIEFLHKDGMFLSKKGLKTIEVTIANVKKIKLKISKIYENNILSALENGYSNRYHDEYDYESESYSDIHSYVKGDIIYEKEINTSKLPGNKLLKYLKLDIEDKLKAFDGIYHIDITSNEDYWASDAKFISISDIGLISKIGKNKIDIFCNSIENTSSLANTKIKLFGANNQIVGQGVTDAEGHLTIEYNDNEFSGFMPIMISADFNGDYTILPFKFTLINTSRFEIGGKNSNPTGWDTYLYPERDLYRPGETINLAGVLRTNSLEIVKDIPVKLVVKMPNGQNFTEQIKTVNEQGSFEYNIPFPNNTPTGVYLFEVYATNDVLLTSEQIMVEEFMPDRIKVTSTLNKKVFDLDEIIKIDIGATNFFGTPASKRNFEVEIQIKADDFKPDAYKHFNFNLSNDQTFFESQTFSGVTNENGNGIIEYKIPKSFVGHGVLEANFYITVFDENGRAVHKKNEAKIITQSQIIGLQSNSGYHTTNMPINFKLVALNNQYQTQNTEVNIEIFKIEYQTVLEDNYGSYRYNSRPKHISVFKNRFRINQLSNFIYTPTKSGSFEIRVSFPGALGYVSSNFFAYFYGNTTNSDFEIDRDGLIEIETSKNEYSVGESMNCIFKTPFDGKLLVTLEQNNVLTYKYIEAKDKSANITFPISAEHSPNIYISATLIKPHGISALPLTVAHGIKSIKVNIPNRQIPVSIQSVDKSKSDLLQEITVKSIPGAMVTIAAVDEGILQISGFNTPDIYNYFYGKRSLGVKSCNIYPYLFREVSSSTGGDGGLDITKRLNPVNTNRIQLVSFWSGLLKADALGNVTFKIKIPQYSGNIRIMAVAHLNNQFGSNAKSLLVADPIIISTGLPRFLAPNDSLKMNISLTNTTEKLANCQLEIKTEQGLDLVNKPILNYEIAAGKETMVNASIVAADFIGASKVHIAVKYGNETYRQDLEIPIRPASSLTTISKSDILQSGKTQIQFPKNQFLPNYVNHKIVVSKNPLAQFGSCLQYLIKYPHGCGEQIISTAFPQLYVSELSQNLSRGQVFDAKKHVEMALNRLKTLEVSNGGISYWPENGNGDWYLTTYAAHFYTEAQKAGYNIDTKFLERKLDYIKFKLKEKAFVTYTYNVNQVKQIVRPEIIYSLYVLAINDRPDKALMNQMMLNSDKLTIDSRYMLGAAFFHTGNSNILKSFITQNWAIEQSVKTGEDYFFSPIKDKAMMLNALIETDPSNPQIPQLIRFLNAEFVKSNNFNTQEAAWPLIALGKLKKSMSNSNAIVYQNNKIVGNTEQGDVIIETKNISNIEIQNKGTGQIYYFIESTGIESNVSKSTKDNGIKIRKRLLTREGLKINPTDIIKQNQLVYIELQLENKSSYLHKNILITDLLPAGFEIENSRLLNLENINPSFKANEPNYKDIRDDRIFIYTDMSKEPQKFYYAVRAVSCGNFALPSVYAESMYLPEINSVFGGSFIEIKN